MRRPRLLMALAVAVVLGGAAGASAKPSKPTLRVQVTGGGSVSSLDGRIDCGRRCSTTLKRGAVRELTASPDDYFEFVGWRGACFGTAPGCLVAVDRPTRVRADFKRMTGIVYLTVTGPGAISVEPVGGLERSGTGGFEVPQGKTVRLVPQADAGAQLKGWGQACAGQPLDGCTLLGNDLHIVTAAFGQATPGQGMRRLTVTGGLVHSTPPGISCQPACEADFPAGTVVTLDFAAQYPDHEWGGACSGSGPSCLLVMDTSLQVSVYVFNGEHWPDKDVRVTVSGPGRVTDGVSLTCGQGAARCRYVYYPSRTVRLRAYPSRRARFVGWGGSCNGRQPVCDPSREGAWALFRFRPRFRR